jgi:hypothetical protein
MLKTTNCIMVNFWHTLFDNITNEYKTHAFYKSKFAKNLVSKFHKIVFKIMFSESCILYCCTESLCPLFNTWTESLICMLKRSFWKHTSGWLKYAWSARNIFIFTIDWSKLRPFWTLYNRNIPNFLQSHKKLIKFEH